MWAHDALRVGNLGRLTHPESLKLIPSSVSEWLLKFCCLTLVLALGPRNHEGLTCSTSSASHGSTERHLSLWRLQEFQATLCISPQCIMLGLSCSFTWCFTSLPDSSYVNLRYIGCSSSVNNMFVLKFLPHYWTLLLPLYFNSNVLCLLIMKDVREIQLFVDRDYCIPLVI